MEKKRILGWEKLIEGSDKHHLCAENYNYGLYAEVERDGDVTMRQFHGRILDIDDIELFIHELRGLKKMAKDHFKTIPTREVKDASRDNVN